MPAPGPGCQEPPVLACRLPAAGAGGHLQRATAPHLSLSCLPGLRPQSGLGCEPVPSAGAAPIQAAGDSPSLVQDSGDAGGSRSCVMTTATHTRGDEGLCPCTAGPWVDRLLQGPGRATLQPGGGGLPLKIEGQHGACGPHASWGTCRRNRSLSRGDRAAGVLLPECLRPPPTHTPFRDASKHLFHCSVRGPGCKRFSSGDPCPAASCPTAL